MKKLFSCLIASGFVLGPQVYAATLLTCEETITVKEKEKDVRMKEIWTFESKAALGELVKDVPEFFQGIVSRQVGTKEKEVMFAAKCATTLGKPIAISCTSYVNEGEGVRGSPITVHTSTLTLGMERRMPGNLIFISGGPSAGPKVYWEEHYRLELSVYKKDKGYEKLSKQFPIGQCKEAK